MTEKYLLFSLNDAKAKKLGEAISSSTCKKIVNLLAEKEASENDLAKELKLPINTIEYNLKKLLDAGVIEKSKNYFWSKKGKKIDMYKVANKLIVIAPKKSSNFYSKLKGIVPVVLIAAVLTIIVELCSKTSKFATTHFSQLSEATKGAASPEAVDAFNVTSGAGSAAPNIWIWFAIGCVTVIIVFLIFNWKKL